MVYSKKTIYLSNKIIWYKFKIKHKHFRFEIFLSQNLIIKLRNNGNILFSQRAPSANPTTSKKQSSGILLSVTIALNLETGAIKAKLFLLTFDESKTAIVSFTKW